MFWVRLEGLHVALPLVVRSPCDGAPACNAEIAPSNCIFWVRLESLDVALHGVVRLSSDRCAYLAEWITNHARVEQALLPPPTAFAQGSKRSS